MDNIEVVTIAEAYDDLQKGYMGFKALAAKTSPAIAAAVGRKKYGKKKFQEAAAKGKKMKGETPLKSKKKK